MSTARTSGVRPGPQNLRPTTLRAIVLALWIAVGVFAGAGIAAVIGSVQLVDPADLSVSEHVAITGDHAGAYFVASVVALGAVAVVEAVLLTVGHVQNIEQDLEPSESSEPSAG